MSNVDTCVLTISREVWTTGFTKYIIFILSILNYLFKQDHILYQTNGLEIK